MTKRTDIREWAREHVTGVANVTLPSFTSDLAGLDEAAIRHDIRRHVENGFTGTLMVGEVVLRQFEYDRFLEIAVDEAAGRLHLIHHACFDTPDENARTADVGAALGMRLSLLTYPAWLYAEDEQQIYAYTKAFCDRTSLGVILFPVPLWNFTRVHPAGLSADLIERLIDDCPNVCAIKAEGGYPSPMGFVECYRRFSERVIVTNPLETDILALAQIAPVQFMGTSNSEYFGNAVPRLFDMVRQGRLAEATELYWKVDPARRANALVSATWAGTGLVSRLQWKYQAWLSGYSGGPLRQPTMRLKDSAMSQLRSGLVASGLPVTSLHDRDFFAGLR
ncbi:dihydrodipicolinate synthase family protein [Rhizorhabdus argentea]|uniref:dihydrodipicolinate synthase family protein n=1 Tax=Rhizorhabdus argentea TaxID=1387174 RepID=UPI0030EEF2A4